MQQPIVINVTDKIHCQDSSITNEKSYYLCIQFILAKNYCNLLTFLSKFRLYHMINISNNYIINAK